MVLDVLYIHTAGFAAMSAWDISAQGTNMLVSICNRHPRMSLSHALVSTLYRHPRGRDICSGVDTVSTPLHIYINDHLLHTGVDAVSTPVCVIMKRRNLPILALRLPVAMRELSGWTSTENIESLFAFSPRVPSAQGD